MTANETIVNARANRMGFLTETDVAVIAADDATRLTPMLVRCNQCRFTAPAQDVQHLIAIIEASQKDWIRDVSLAR